MEIKSNSITNVSIGDQHPTILFNGDKMIYRDNSWIHCKFAPTAQSNVQVLYEPNGTLELYSIYNGSTKIKLSSGTSSGYTYYYKPLPAGTYDIYLRGKELCFYNDALLTECIIPSGFTGTLDVRKSADTTAGVFENCKALTTITLPDKYSPAFSTFKNCTALTTVNYNGNNYSLRGYNFYGCTNLANIDTSKIISFSSASYGFYNCKSLPAFDFSKYSVNIPTFCFYGANVSKSDFSGLYGADKSAFNGATLPTNFVLTRVKSLGSLAFGNTKGPTSVTIGPNISGFTDNPFYGSSIVKYYIDENNTGLFTDANNNYIYSNTTLYCVSKNYTGDIPNVSKIVAYAFTKGSRTSVTIGDAIASIGSNNGGWGTTIYIKAATPPTIASTTFDQVPAHIYVPADSVSAYQAASNWTQYASKIEAIPTE